MTNCRKCGWHYKNIEDWLKHQKERHSQYVYKAKNSKSKHEGMSNMRKVRMRDVPRRNRVEKIQPGKATRDYRRHHKDEE